MAENDGNVTPQMSQLQGSHPQAVFMEGLGAPAGYALVARTKLGWKVPVAFDIAASSLDLTKLVPAADIPNTYEDVFYEQNPMDPVPGIKAMLQYTKPYGTVGPAALDTMRVGGDALVDLNDAVKTAGGAITASALHAAMLHIPATDPLRTFSLKLGYTGRRPREPAGGDPGLPDPPRRSRRQRTGSLARRAGGGGAL
jgi:hypothetical protein